jgi:hypothetical protein
VASLGEKPFQLQRDLPVSTCDYYVHGSEFSA